MKKIEFENYDLVIGLGDYRKDAKVIRFETRFVNKYGRNKILENGKESYNADVDWLTKILPNPPLSKERIGMQISNSVTNGPCNRSVYLIFELIERKELKTKLIFLHVPRKMNFENAKSLLLNLIQNIF